MITEKERLFGEQDEYTEVIMRVGGEGQYATLYFPHPGLAMAALAARQISNRDAMFEIEFPDNVWEEYDLGDS